MDKIKKLAFELYETHGTCNPFRIAEALGIYVIYSDLPDVTSGLYYYIGNKKIILINQNLDERYAKITAAHELGHALIHPNCNYIFMSKSTLMNTKRYETEADYFCACLLMCENGEKIRRDDSCERVACITGLPIETAQLWMEKNIVIENN